MTNNKAEIIKATYEAEDSLIGAILVESTDGTRDAINKVAPILSSADFYNDMNRRIYEAMLKCPEPPHQINVARQMVIDGSLVDGAVSYLCHCVSEAPCSLDYMDYALSVKAYSEMRQGYTPKVIKGAI